MLVLTTDAADVIRELAAAPEADGLRISAAPPSADSDGPALQLALASGPADEDAVVETEDARVFLDPPAARALEHKVLDADVEAGEVNFTIREQ